MIHIIIIISSIISIISIISIVIIIKRGGTLHGRLLCSYYNYMSICRYVYMSIMCLYNAVGAARCAICL